MVIGIKHGGGKGKTLPKKQEQYVLEFCHSDKSSTIHYNSKYIVDIKRGVFIEKHVGRVWLGVAIDERIT